MKSRLNLPAPESMSPQQRVIYDDVLRTRGNLHGPFLAWLVNPRLAQPAQELGAFCRYGTSLSMQESELLILFVAAHYGCGGEQQIHEPIARKVGLSGSDIDAIRAGAMPEFEDPRLGMLADLAHELVTTKRLSALTYEKGASKFGEKALVEIVAVIGYYSLVAYTLNAFEMRLQ